MVFLTGQDPSDGPLGAAHGLGDVLVGLLGLLEEDDGLAPGGAQSGSHGH